MPEDSVPWRSTQLNRIIRLCGGNCSGFYEESSRGVVFKTVDGGANWEKVFFHSDSLGIFLIWARSRMIQYDLCRLLGGWSASLGRFLRVHRHGGVYKSTECRKDLTKLTKGLPTPNLIGKDWICGFSSGSSGGLCEYRSFDKQGGLYTARLNRVHLDMSPIIPTWTKSTFFTTTNIYAKSEERNRFITRFGDFNAPMNGGKTWKSLSNPHGDHHDIWQKPKRIPDLIRPMTAGR